MRSDFSLNSELKRDVYTAVVPGIYLLKYAVLLFIVVVALFNIKGINIIS